MNNYWRTKKVLLKRKSKRVITVLLTIMALVFNLFSLPVLAAELEQEVAFVDLAIEDAKTLGSGVRAGVQIVYINSEVDGLQEMANWLKDKHNMDAIHIISHGEPGKLFLGSSILTDENMDKYSAILAEVGNSLKKGGDILIYGCDVAKGETGKQFVDGFVKATGADVAASTDTTGAAALGGDWTLEAQIGKVNSIPFVVSNFGGLLANIIPITQTTNQTLTNGVEDIVLFPNGFANGDVRAWGPDDLNIEGVPVFSGFNANEDKIDLRQIVFSATPTYGTQFYNKANPDEYGTDMYYTAWSSGTKYGLQFGIVGNTLRAGEGTLGVLVGYSDSYSTTVCALFHNVTGTITAANFIFPNSNISPAINNLSGDSAVYIEGGAAVLLDSGTPATVTDSDSTDFSTGNVTASITSSKVASEDILGIDTSGTVSLSAGLTVGSSVRVSGIDIGTIAANGTGLGGNNLIITLNDKGTPTTVGKLIQALTYSNSNTTNPSTTSRTVAVTINDGDGGTSTAATATITVTDVNDAPTLTATTLNPTFTEGGSAVSLFSGTTISTIEALQNIKKLTLKISNLVDGSSEQFTADGSMFALTNGTTGKTTANGFSYTVAVTGSEATVTISKPDTAANWALLVNGLKYSYSSSTMTIGGRDVTLTSVTDDGGVANSGVDTTALSISAHLTVALQPAKVPTISVSTNGGYIKKDAIITLASQTGATIYYTAKIGSAPTDPTTGAAFVTDGGTITLPDGLTCGNTLYVKAYAVVSGRPDSSIASFQYAVQPKKELTLTGITVSDKEYNGGTDAAADFSNAVLSGIIGSDVITLTGTPAASFLTATTENSKPVTVSGYLLSGPYSDYYTLKSTLPVTANITKKALSLGTISVSNREYNGGVEAVVSAVSIANGKVGSDIVSVDVASVTAAFSSAVVGNAKTVNVSGIILTGADSANYSIVSTGTAFADITPKTVTVESVTIANKPYDGTTAATITGATLNGRVGSEDVSIDYITTPIATAVFENSMVGNGKQVTITGLKLGGSDKANYILASSSFTTTGAITGLGTVVTPTASIADNTVIKSGTAVTLETVGYNGANLYYTMGTTQTNPNSSSSFIFSGSTVTITGNPGEIVKLSVYGTKAGYIDSPIAIFHYPIQAKRTLTVTGASVEGRDYDGTCNAKVTGGTLSGSIESGDDVTLVTLDATGQFVDKNAGTKKAVIASGYTLAGADAMYYALTQPELTADIRPKSININSIIISDKSYDGTTIATISDITLNGVVSVNSVVDNVYAVISSATATFADGNLGKGKTVNVSGLVLAGTDVANYQLASSTATTTGNIVVAGTVAMPTAIPGEASILSGTGVTLITATNGAKIHYTMDGSLPTVSSSTYAGPIIVTGTPGTVITIRAIATKIGMTDSGVLTKEYTIAAPGDFIITPTTSNQTIRLSWEAIPNTVTYKVYDSQGSYLGEGISVSASVYGYIATGLINGNSYTFTVKALDTEQRVVKSARISAIPRTTSGAPTGVTAVAGYGKATVTFNVPTDNGGSEITDYIVTSTPGNITATGKGSPITVTGLTNGISYTFTVKAVNSVGTGLESTVSNAVTPRSSSGGGDSSSVITNNPTTSVEVLVNGKTENAGTIENGTISNGQTFTTITVDEAKIEQRLKQEGKNAVVTIPVNNKSDVIVGVLSGQMVKSMEAKEAVLELKAEAASYILPAAQINIDSVSQQLGNQVELKDIKVTIEISKITAETSKVVENSAKNGEFTILAPPVEFTVKCTSKDKTVVVSQFNTYVERTIAIPDGVDPSKITTGVVIDTDGTARHVPTKVVVIGGKYYAKINSLTNSTYLVVWHPYEFKDMVNHWAKAEVNDMGSRMVVSGVNGGIYEPDRDITRGEFAAIMVKALGLKPGLGNNPFSDISSTAWYSDYVKTAYLYKIITGYEDGSFKAMNKITREEAMTMIVRAMDITGLKFELTKADAEKLLSGFKDGSTTSDWAWEEVAACIKTGVVSGRDNGIVAPNDSITRAEVAVIVKRLLQKSGLI